MPTSDPAPSTASAPVGRSTTASASAATPVAPPAPKRRARAGDHGPSADFDGDGFADLVLREGDDAIHIVPGSRDGPRLAGKIDVAMKDARWNFGMAATGDFDGDGNIDLAFGVPLYSARAFFDGAVAVLMGSVGQLPHAVTKLLQVEGLGPHAQFGAAVVAGDFDADGFDDLLVAAPATQSHGGGKVFLFRGSAAGLAKDPALTIEHPAQANDTAFGAGLANLGDVDGDGIDDLAIGAYRDDGKRGAVYVYRGGRGGPGREPWLVLRGPKGVRTFGYAVERAGDVDGDGRPDLLVGCQRGRDERAFLFLAGAGGFSASPSQVLFERGPGAGSLATAGDVDADGHADLLAGDSSRSPYGRAMLLRGGVRGYDAAHPIDLPNRWSERGHERFAPYFGHGAVPAGDVNGDGIDDVVVAGHTFTFFWPGGKPFVPGAPAVVPGTTAGAPTFSE